MIKKYDGTKPRTWVLPLKTLIVNDGQGMSAWVRQDREDETHVIEYSAFEEAVKFRDYWQLRCKKIERELEALNIENRRLEDKIELIKDLFKQHESTKFKNDGSHFEADLKLIQELK